MAEDLKIQHNDLVNYLKENLITNFFFLEILCTRLSRTGYSFSFFFLTLDLSRTLCFLFPRKCLPTSKGGKQESEKTFFFLSMTFDVYSNPKPRLNIQFCPFCDTDTLRNINFSPDQESWHPPPQAHTYPLRRRWCLSRRRLYLREKLTGLTYCGKWKRFVFVYIH